MIEKDDNRKIKEKKEEYLTRFIHRSVSIPELDLNSWSKFFDAVLNFALSEIQGQLEVSENKELGNELFTIREDLSRVLSTPRLIKLFGRTLKTKIKLFSKDLYLRDVIALCAVQAANQSLYHSISRNKEYFIDPNTTDEYIMEIIRERSRPNDQRRQRIEKFLNSLKTSTLASDHEINILISVFHNLQSDEVRIPAKDLLLKRRLSHAIYFDIFFNYSELPHAISLDGLQEIRDTCKHKQYMETSKIILEQYNSLKGTSLTKSYIIFISTLIERDLSISDAEKLLFAFAVTAKSFSRIEVGFGLSDKISASFTIWDFVARLENSSKRRDVLLQLINEKVSHDFLTNVVFYSTHPERRPNNVELNPEHVAEIKKRFVEFCENKFYKDAKPLNIFDSENSDSPIQMLFRWQECVKDDFDHSQVFDNFMAALIRDNIDVTKILLDEILPFSGSTFSERIINGIMNLNTLIPIKKFIEVASQHIGNLVKEKPVYKSLIEEIKSFVKNSDN